MDKKEKCRNTQLKRIVIHKNETEKRVYKQDLDQYLSDGWLVGVSEAHRKSMSKSRVGIEPWNKDTIGIMKKNKTSFQKGRTPWNKNKKGVQKGWNKGLTKDTDGRVKKYSESNKKDWETNTSRRQKATEIGKNSKGRKLTQEQLEHFLMTNYQTRLKNGTFNSSKPEDDMYNDLCTVYDKQDIKRQYRDKERYPYRCDFYIVSQDLFIECNLHWTHGGRPFDETSEDCIRQLREWEEKAKVSKYYEIAIETWTVRDVNKLSIAKQNNLNYKVIYSI